VLAVALTAPASAAPWAPKKKPARDLLSAAADAAEAGDYPRSAALSLQSLDLEASIFALWNAGQAFMDAGEWSRALEHYDRALADADLPRKQRPRIEARRSLARAFVDANAAAEAARWDEARAAYLAILDRDDLSPLDRQHAGTALEQLAQSRAAAESAAAAPPSATTNSTAAAASSPAATPTPAPLDMRAPARPSRWSDTSALAILSTGAIGVGAGAWLTFRAQDLDDQADAPETAEPDRPGLRDRASSSRTGATIAFAAGGALLLAGAIKLAIPPDAPRPSLATLQPTTGGALVIVGGRF
jgi:tetratricopeptide (TPR) repeat protein